MADRRVVGLPGDEISIDLRRPSAPLIETSVYARDRSAYERWVKPPFDFFGALAMLVFTLPLLIACAIAVRIQFGSPVILHQQRVGRGGRVFTLYKFRTMEPDRRHSQAPFSGPDRRVTHKSADDPRLKPVGRFLRKWSLDELPQVVNVLRGEMSLVGPRPELVELVTSYEKWQHRRHAVKPGITGLWQVSERGDKVLHECTEIDLEYIEEISLWFDLKLLLLTPLAALGLRPGF
jgi:lipopolysaccharide/colanic/teichoic acid biosynthesis glycosyltransferase